MKEKKEFFIKKWWRAYLQRIVEEQKKGHQCTK